jgi:quercetin dioxygenase-like cupin family protein
MSLDNIVYRISDLPVQDGGAVQVRAIRSESSMVTFVRILFSKRHLLHGAHRHPYQQMIIVTKGSMTIRIEGHPHDMPAGSAIVVPADAWHVAEIKGEEDVELMEILTPPRDEYVHLTAHQSEKFSNSAGESWFRTEADKGS